MTQFPPSKVFKGETSPAISFLRNIFGPLGSFLGAFIIVCNPLIHFKIIAGVIILWRSYDYMSSKRKRILSICLACIGALFAFTSYLGDHSSAITTQTSQQPPEPATRSLSKESEYQKERVKDSPVMQELAEPESSTNDKLSGFYNAGVAIGGQEVKVDLDSIRRVPDSEDTEFVYYLGSERISSIANCAEGTWVTLPENQRHSPQSTATTNMINRVCR